jgi:hypothetical protein
MKLKWYLLAVLFLLSFAYEYVKHVLIEGYKISTIVPSLLYYGAIIVPLVLWSFSKMERQERKLREYAEEMKQKVEERTRELRESEEKYRMLVENATDGIFMTDMEGNFIFVNNRMCEIHGYTREELLSMHASELAGARAAKVKAQFLEILERGETQGAVEVPAFKKDGTPIYTKVRFKVVEEGGKPTGVYGLVSDVTETKRLEEALKLRSEKLAMLNDMVAEISHKLDYNRVLKLTAEKAAELVEAETVAIPIVSEDSSTISYPAAYGKHATMLLGRSKPLRKRSICGWVIRNKKPFYSEDIMRDRRELMEVKKLLNLRTAISAPLLYKGRVFGGITALNKLSGDAFTKEDLQLLCILASNAAIALRNAMLMEELKRSNELKDLFTDIMRHDLLNPVSVIKGLSEIMLRDKSLEKHRKSLGKIRRSAKKLEEMIESASKYARLEDAKKLDLEERDIAAIMAGVIRDFEPLFKEKKISVEYMQGRCLARVNPVIEDVFANLLSNAIKYSPAGSKVVVEIAKVGNECQVMVKDYGEGIPDEAKERIFERFTSLQKEGIKGIGLGLAIAKRIVELHRGKIWVEDNPEGGSIFYVRLPSS